MGAYRTWMLSALSDDIKAGCAICWMITTEAQLTKKYGRKEMVALPIPFLIYDVTWTIPT